MNRSSVDLEFLDFTLAMILERSAFENVSTMLFNDFYPGFIKLDCLEYFVAV